MMYRIRKEDGVWKVYFSYPDFNVFMDDYTTFAEALDVTLFIAYGDELANV